MISYIFIFFICSLILVCVMILFSSFCRGHVYANGVRRDGNAPVAGGAQVLLEVNMSAIPHTLHLYIDKTLQPICIKGFPDAMHFVVGLYFANSMVQLKTFRQILPPS